MAPPVGEALVAASTAILVGLGIIAIEQTKALLSENSSSDDCDDAPKAGAAGEVEDLTGRSTADAEKALGDQGFVEGKPTAGGYRKFKHPDGSVVWIRPNGEVVRIAPRAPDLVAQTARSTHRGSVQTETSLTVTHPAPRRLS